MNGWKQVIHELKQLKTKSDHLEVNVLTQQTISRGVVVSVEKCRMVQCTYLATITRN